MKEREIEENKDMLNRKRGEKNGRNVMEKNGKVLIN